MKTAVIVTNRGSDTEGPIFKISAYVGAAVWTPDALQLPFVIDFDEDEIVIDWGGVETMTKAESQKYGADFGIWFAS